MFGFLGGLKEKRPRTDWSHMVGRLEVPARNTWMILIISGSGEPTCHQFALARGLGRQNLGHACDPLLLLENRVQLREAQRR